MSTNLLTPDIPRLHSIAGTLEQKQLTYLRGKVLTVSLNRSEVHLDAPTGGDGPWQ